MRVRGACVRIGAALEQTERGKRLVLEFGENRWKIRARGLTHFSAVAAGPWCATELCNGLRATVDRPRAVTGAVVSRVGAAGARSRTCKSILSLDQWYNYGMLSATDGANGRNQTPFARVPMVAIRDWSRDDLLTYVALASWPPGSELSLAEIRERARIGKQGLLRSLNSLERCGTLKRTRRSGYPSAYELTRRPREQWVRMPVTVLQDQELNRTAVLVYLALASFASSKGRQAWPAIETLAKRAGVSPRSVYAALAVLRQRYIYRYYLEKGARYGLRKKPKLTVVRMVTRLEDPVTSIYRAAVRGEHPPVIPDKFLAEEIIESDLDTGRTAG